MKNDAKKILTISILSVFFLLILIFGFYRSYDLIFGVKIKNVNLVDGMHYTETVIDVIGRAKNAKNLTLNGREISIDKEGNFNEKIALLPGYNIITIKALDKFGHTDEKNFHLVGGTTIKVQ